MRRSRTGDFYVRSAFQLAYSVIFLYAAGGLAVSMFTADNPVKKQIEVIYRAVIDATGKDLWSLNALGYGIGAFAIVFAFHLVRIYLTLEAMEDEEVPFKGFYDDFGEDFRKLEFAVRTIIIAVVSLEVIKVDGFESFAWYVFIFYLTVTAWSLIALYKGKKFFGNSFSVSSFSGLLFAIILLAVQYQDRWYSDFWQLAQYLIWFAAGALAADLIYYGVRNWRRLKIGFKLKICVPW